jgi:DnaJ-class molecular chaperone
LQVSEPNHYATLGLDRDCTDQQIRAAYRLLAKQHHPDLNSDSPEASGQTRALNAAYAILSDPAKRQTYDRQLSAQNSARPRTARSQRNLSQEVHLRIEDFLRGTTLQVSIHDPVQRNNNETYELIVPPETAPGTRFRLARTDEGFVTVKARVRPDFRFKARGADLRCDLRISSQRALRGGSESVRGVTGNFLRVQIPARVERGEIIRIVGEGLPKARGGRGDLLVRVIYRPEVRITRATRS